MLGYHLLNFRLIQYIRIQVHCSKLVIIIIAIELRLDRVSPEGKRMLLKLFILLVLPVLVNILLVKIVLLGRQKRCLHLLVPEVLPREVFEPGVRFHLGWPVLTQAVQWFTLDHLQTNDT